MKVVETASGKYELVPTGRDLPQETLVIADGSELIPGVGFNLALNRFGAKGPFQTPRHHHSFEQVRYVVDGVANFAPKLNIPAGQVAFFPAGAYYGPQDDPDSTVLYFQYGENYMTAEQKAEASKEMEKTGTMTNGVFTDVDPETGKKRNRDGVRALFETVHGRPEVYPEPRYPETIVMNPEAFEWRPLQDGLLEKHLGTFTEREVRISVLRWEQSARYELPPGRAEVLFTTADGVKLDGTARPARTGAFSPHSESLALDGEPGAETLLVVVPAVAVGAAVQAA